MAWLNSAVVDDMESARTGRGLPCGEVSLLDRRRSEPRNAAADPLVRADEYGHIFLENVEQGGVGLAVMDPRMRIKETNAAFLEHTGFHARQIRDRALFELLHPAIRQHVMRQFERLQQRRCNRFMERLPALWATQTEFSWDLTGMAVVGDVGDVKTFVMLADPARLDEDSRVLISPKKVLKQIDARILEGVATGVTTVQLAASLYLSRQGIEYHVSNMLRQFKVTNRAALVSKAYSMGLFGVGSWPPRVLPEYIQE
ncbi:LuxR C-terminal-related transcriptional regulator [Streptacidiphilus sp. EB129]|jgi:DNA-binding CsgD family transcriptional regulator|uniref:LuxR C-terminal-related transcriptional regulator n=1 Tax=Streptacidiphilus sp. EB129 TaxID=3156262 RepID=UPI003512AE78